MDSAYLAWPKGRRPHRLAHEALIIRGTGHFEGASGTGSHDVFFTDSQGDFVFNAETTITLQRPWNVNA